jgi:hypothetical protein
MAMRRTVRLGESRHCITRARRGVPQAFRVPQQGFPSVDLAANQQLPGVSGAEHRARAHHRIRQSLRPGQLDQTRRALEIPGGEGVADCVGWQTVVFVPLAGAAMERRDAAGLLLRRPPSPPWRTFLRVHAHAIWASDLFTVQTLTFRTLYVFVVISHDRRRIDHWDVTAHPITSWI